MTETTQRPQIVRVISMVESGNNRFVLHVASTVEPQA